MIFFNIKFIRAIERKLSYVEIKYYKYILRLKFFLTISILQFCESEFLFFHQKDPIACCYAIVTTPPPLCWVNILPDDESFVFIGPGVVQAVLLNRRRSRDSYPDDRRTNSHLKTQNIQIWYG